MFWSVILSTSNNEPPKTRDTMEGHIERTHCCVSKTRRSYFEIAVATDIKVSLKTSKYFPQTHVFYLCRKAAFRNTSSLYATDRTLHTTSLGSLRQHLFVVKHERWIHMNFTTSFNITLHLSIAKMLRVICTQAHTLQSRAASFRNHVIRNVTIKTYRKCRHD